VDTSDPDVRTLSDLAFNLPEGHLPDGPDYLRHLESAFEAVKSRSINMPQTTAIEFFHEWVKRIQADKDFLALQKHREQMLRLVREIRDQVDRELEAEH